LRFGNANVVRPFFIRFRDRILDDILILWARKLPRLVTLRAGKDLFCHPEQMRGASLIMLRPAIRDSVSLLFPALQSVLVKVSMRLTIFLFALFTATALFAEEEEELVENRVVETRDGTKIHCLEKGRGRSILFIPGWTMPAEIWAPQINHFAPSYHVVAMDPRCQGESSQTTKGLDPATRARDIKAVVDKLKLAPVALVGWSSGVGEIASYVQQFGTDTVRGLVLVDGIAGTNLPSGMKPEDLPFLAALRKDRATFADEFVRGLFKKPQSESYLKNLIATSQRTPTATAEALSIAAVKADNRTALNKIDKPTLIVVATIPQAAAEDMKKRIKNSTLEVFDGTGHAIFVDDVIRFNTILDHFLTEVAY
jgi:non-heme chloroperoxidase